MVTHANKGADTLVTVVAVLLNAVNSHAGYPTDNQAGHARAHRGGTSVRN